MLNWKEYKAQGVKSVDMCAATICLHRSKNMPIKAIHLIPRLYDEFKQWTELNLKKELAEGEKIQFDDVHIELGTSSQSSQLVIELYMNGKELEEFMNSELLNKSSEIKPRNRHLKIA